MSDSKALDILGIKPIADAANTAVTKSFEGIEGFLKLVCAPALEEVGLLLKDHVKNWRLNNIVNIIEKAKGKLDFDGEHLYVKAHPRVALSIIENGSVNDSDEIQELWAGLFASSCTKDGQDDENIIFVDLLKKLTLVEARILKYSCEKARKILYKNGLINGDEYRIPISELSLLTGIEDIHRLDRELDHMRNLGLIGTGLSGGFSAEDETLVADISPSALSINLYIRSQGFSGDPTIFWTSNIIKEEDMPQGKSNRGAFLRIQ